jgi:DNA invertase Pin-like site-specific DNA recombinase
MIALGTSQQRPHGLRALTDKEVEEVRELRKKGLKLRQIAKIYNISQSLVSRTCNYKYVEQEST